MRIILVCMSVFALVSCAEYPYRGNYYGNNRYVTTPYYGGYSGYVVIFLSRQAWVCAVASGVEHST